MFIFKNALISIIRNKGRNILIGIIILVIACAATVALAINNTASDLISSYQSAYDKELTISFNRKNMMEDFDFGNRDEMENMKNKFEEISTYTIADVVNFAESDYIESYYYTYNISLNGKNIEKAEVAVTHEGPARKEVFGGEEGLTLNGYSSLLAMSEFIEGTYEMTEIVDGAWDKAFEGNYIFINEELASYNSLTLDSTVELEDEDGNVYEFVIIGIYKENETGISAPMDLFSNSANTIITNAEALVAIAESNSNITGSVNPTFIIHDYGDKDKIQAEFYEKGLDENYALETNEEIATAGLSSIKNVQSFANTFLIITLTIGGIVLLVINMINIRERKYEIGVLRTIGISKTKLNIQFVSELMMVGVVALVIGASVGAIISKSVGNSLLASEISSSQETSERINANFGGPNGMMPAGGGGGMMENFTASGTPKIEAYESMDAVVNVGVLLELFGIGLALVLISSLAAMINIQRFTPLTILKERS